MSKRPGDPGYAAGWCIHFRSMGHHDTCEKGVAYESFKGATMDTRPCFLTKAGGSNPGALPCEHLRRPTPEEIAAHEMWLKGRMERMSTAMQAMAPYRETHKGSDAVIDCPVCKVGKLQFSIARNGHCHARCTTADCVAWME